jgi:hypothetical protein
MQRLPMRRPARHGLRTVEGALITMANGDGVVIEAPRHLIFKSSILPTHSPADAMTRFRFLMTFGSAALLGAVGMPGAGLAQPLYMITTTCSLKGAAPVPCTVEAVDMGEATEYRHRIGATKVTYRVFDDPYVRVDGMDPATGSWIPARNASIRFSRNELCFNDRAFCVVNPNYLNSVRQEAGPTYAGRDLVGLSFGTNGRVDIACFDDGCRRLREAIEQ